MVNMFWLDSEKAGIGENVALAEVTGATELITGGSTVVAETGGRPSRAAGGENVSGLKGLYP